MQNLGSGSGQQQVVSCKAVVSEAVVNGEENDGEERLCLFRNIVSGKVFYALLDYRPLGGTNDLVKGAIGN